MAGGEDSGEADTGEGGLQSRLRGYGWAEGETEATEQGGWKFRSDLGSGREAPPYHGTATAPRRAPAQPSGPVPEAPDSGRARRRLGAALILLAGLALVLVLLNQGSAPSRRAPPALTRAHVHTRTLRLGMRWNLFGARPTITVRVGNGPSVPVLLDTGSTGLHIYAPGIRLGSGGGVRVSSRQDSARYFDGTLQQGRVARARLTIGGVRTARSVPFGLINYVGCVHAIPCPGARGIRGSIARGEYGILGVGLSRSRDRLGNPLLELPRADRESWSIALGHARGSLTLGAPDPGHPLARFPLTRDGRDPSGLAAWHDQRVHVCWAAAGLRGAGCEPTVFDTGSQIMFWYGGLMSHATTYPGSILVNPGTYIAAWQSGHGRPFWSFTAGTDASRNTVFALNLGHPGVIAAVQAFLNFRITYDAERGEIFIARGT